MTELSLMLSGDATPLLEMDDFTIKAPQLDIIRQTIAVDSIRFAGALISVVIDETGDLNWKRIPSQPEVAEVQASGTEAEIQAAGAESTSKLSSPEAEPSRPWQVQVAQVSLGDVYFQYKDTSRSPQLLAEIGDLSTSFKALWKDLFQKLVAEAQLSETALLQLAETRASAVLAELQGTAGLAQHRTMLKAAKVLKPGKTPRVKMMLEPLRAKRVKKSESQPE